MMLKKVYKKKGSLIEHNLGISHKNQKIRYQGIIKTSQTSSYKNK